ncbi:MAG TPA: S41 family peptidase [Fimbriimonadaceae bacterium]|nr:S41 family peptidase [Fimbriimonadaceae bacterium]
MVTLPQIATLLFAALGPQNQGYYMQPAIGKTQIVFVSEGDLWSVPLTGGLAHELTSHVAPASHPAISPDGAMVAYTGSYEGPSDAYVMPVDGGPPTRLSFTGGMTVVGWAPDGRVLASTGNRSGLPGPELVEIDTKTLEQTEVPLDKANDGEFDATGQTLYFTRFAFQGSHTKRYKGGTAQSIWKYTMGAPEAVPLTKSFPGTSKGPMCWNGRVYFISDRDGVMNVWSMDENGGGLKQLTHSKSWDIQNASLRAGRIAYQLGADIHLLDLGDGSDKTLDISLASDFDQTREHFITNPANYVTALAVATDGSKIVLTARGQVFVAPVEPGRLVSVTRDSSARFRDGLFTPDGKSVLAISDASGENEWWMLPANGVGVAHQVTRDSKVLAVSGSISPDGKHLAFADKNQELWDLELATNKLTKVLTSLDGTPSDLTWSPDSAWLAFRMPTYTFDRIALYTVATGKVTPVTTPRADSASPAWSTDGKWLYFLSNRTFQSVVGAPWGPRQPEPFFDKQTKLYAIGLVKGLRSPFQPADELSPVLPGKPSAGPVKVEVDTDGIQGRLWELPAPAGNYSGLAATADRLYFLNSQSRGTSDLDYLEITNKDAAVKTFAPAVRSFSLTRDTKKLLIARGAGIYVVPAAGPMASLEKPVDLSAWTFPVQPREEWRQMFVDAWRLERDFFYDRNMHGVDWPAILAKYKPLVDRIRGRDELSDLLAQMVGELSALHTFVYGGDQRGSLDRVAPASLGALFSRDVSAGGFRVDRIYSGDPDYPNSMAPLARPEVHIGVGDVITSIDGIATLGAASLDSLLRAKAGRQVLVSVKDHGAGAERQCIVVPMEAGAVGNLRYTDWEVSRRDKVDTAGGGSIGYVHLRAMGSGDIAQWARDFYPVFDRPGLIIDVRHNNGGNIDSWIIEKLLRKAWMYWQDRVGNPTWNMQWAFRGHVVVLCDENTASDGEAFSEGIKRLGLGKVIGSRTWGGEIWLSSDNVLEDFGIATAAETGVYGPEGKWLIEGHGVDPDIVVDNLPHATYLGQDAQLQAGIDYLLKEIKDHPVPVPPSPKHPDKSYPPSQGRTTQP